MGARKNIAAALLGLSLVCIPAFALAQSYTISPAAIPLFEALIKIIQARIEQLNASAPAPVVVQSTPAAVSAFVNFDGQGTAFADQIGQFDTDGNKVDAHDGKLLQVGNTFYLYGTSYGCGFQWGVSGSAFCGFVSYSSPDLVHWTSHGALFDPAAWQSLCGNGRGCFEPKMVYNNSTGQYVLWFLGGADTAPLYVMTCATPTGGCTSQPQPTLHGCPACGKTDHDIFVDSDGSAYIVYNGEPGYNLYVEQLNSAYTNSSGAWVQVPGNGEGLGIFKNAATGTYYVTYGDLCPYCTTGVPSKYSYTTAGNPLSGWQTGGTFSLNTCGAQPYGVNPITVAGATSYVLHADLWLNQSNEALANRFYNTLSFNGNLINPLNCAATVSMSGLSQITSSASAASGAGDLAANFGVGADITAKTWRMQTFTPAQSGTLTGVSITTGQTNLSCSLGSLCASVNGNLVVNIVGLDASNNPTGIIASGVVSASTASWAPQQVRIPLGVAVVAGTHYGLELAGNNTTNDWEYGFSNTAAYPSGVERVSADGGKTWTTEPGKSLRFEAVVNPGSST